MQDKQSNPFVNPSEAVFKFLSYYFDKNTRVATFVYQGIDNIIFTEKIVFAEHPEAKQGRHFNALNDPTLDKILDQALFLAFILIGTSYYKAHPTPNVHISQKIDAFQASFFNKVFQEGLSQYAFENGLSRDHLAHFTPSLTQAESARPYKGKGIISLQSGGKDSLLVATLLRESKIDFIPWYVSSSANGEHPAVIDRIFPQLNSKNASVVTRQIDQLHLQQSGGLNGHVPITYINEALAIVQAILNNQNIIITSIGQEGAEPHSYIGDLAVNHQWSKTWEAELLLSEYVKRYISEDIHIGSPIRKYSELRISELFIHKCWKKYGYQFSSCNEANYKQGANNGRLSWCGHCAKCANTYLLFCPFLAPHILQSLFNDQDLFLKPELTETFKGLLGIDNVLKPFECVGSFEELRFAYHHRLKVPPIYIKDTSSVARNYQTETLNANLVQASARLGMNKFYHGSADPRVRTITTEEKKMPIVEQKYDKNGKPLPLELPEGWWQPLYADLPFIVPESNYNYAYEYDSQPFFKNFFEEHRDK
ncbi:hypothetical protein IJ798_00350 [Candidatus Saccharibacteria bacterium]|nr:hypothetical protein [Candidatus Saccharibacteria bacterium]